MNRRLAINATRRAIAARSHYEDVEAHARYVPPHARTAHVGGVNIHTHQTGPNAGTTMYWWHCSCGAHRVTDSAEHAQRELDAHLKEAA